MLPPAVAGIGLLVAFGRFGLLGLDVRLPRDQRRRSTRPRSCSRSCSSRGRSTSARRSPRSRRSTRTWSRPRARSAPGPLRTFFRVTLPLARGGLAAGEALCLARGLGEFGATIMFAGSLQGRTQTLPLAVYNEFEACNLDVALAISALLVILSLAILLIAQGRASCWQPSQADFALPLRSFDARASARGRGDGRARRAVRRGEDLGAPRGRRARAPGVRADRARRRRLVRLRAAGSSASPTSGGSGSSSRSTRSSRT